MSVPVCCMFFVSQEINIKRSPNAAKLFVDFFGPEDIQWAREAPQRVLRGEHNPPRRARRPRRALVGCAHLGCPLNRLFAL